MMPLGDTKVSSRDWREFEFVAKDQISVAGLEALIGPVGPTTFHGEFSVAGSFQTELAGDFLQLHLVVVGGCEESKTIGFPVTPIVIAIDDFE
jgi:hypothetical protein